MTYKAEYYQIPTGIDKNIAKQIAKTAHKMGSELLSSEIGGMDGNGGVVGKVEKNIRNSRHRWIATDHWVAGMMAHFINEANNMYYQFDLVGWADQIQYTEYSGKGTHYSWHSDSNPAVTMSNAVRKLSISLLLSDPSDYEGGEFQLMFPGNKEMKTFKPEMGQAIIFPSYAAHRVRPLKSGKRMSLVGWYGGPPFR